MPKCAFCSPRHKLRPGHPVSTSLNPSLAAGGDRPRMPWCDWGFGTHRDMPRSSLRRTASAALQPRRHPQWPQPSSGSAAARWHRRCGLMHVLPNIGQSQRRNQVLAARSPALFTAPTRAAPCDWLSPGCHFPPSRLPVTHHLPNPAQAELPRGQPRAKFQRSPPLVRSCCREAAHNGEGKLWFCRRSAPLRPPSWPSFWPPPRLLQATPHTCKRFHSMRVAVGLPPKCVGSAPLAPRA